MMVALRLVDNSTSYRDMHGKETCTDCLKRDIPLARGKKIVMN